VRPHKLKKIEECISNLKDGGKKQSRLNLDNVSIFTLGGGDKEHDVHFSQDNVI